MEYTSLPIIPLVLADWVLNGIFTVVIITRFLVSPYKKQFVINLLNICEVVGVVAVWLCTIMYRSSLISPPEVFDPNVVYASFIIYSLRVIRVVGLFRSANFIVGIRIIVLTIRASVLPLFLLALVMSIFMVMFASFIFYAEFEDDDSDFQSIPRGFWWSIITMTTVGYGDMVPRRLPGYIVGTLCAIAGMVITGLIIPIVSDNFTTYSNYALRLRAQEKAKDSKYENSGLGPL